jgi:hypothetical protein
MLHPSTDVIKIAPKETNHPAQTHKRAPDVGAKGSYLAMKEHGQSGHQPHAFDNTSDRSAQQTKAKHKTFKEFSVTTYNDSTPSQTISQKLLQIINGCKKTRSTWSSSKNID